MKICRLSTQLKRLRPGSGPAACPLLVLPETQLREPHEDPESQLLQKSLVVSHGDQGDGHFSESFLVLFLYINAVTPKKYLSHT